MRNIFLAVSVIALLAGNCQSDIRTTFPDRISGGGGDYSASGPWKEYNKGTLFDYINGGADVYIDAGFIRCRVRGFADTAGDGITVNFYEMGDPIQAFGLFREFYGTDQHIKNIGSEAVLKNRRFIFWKGKYFVEVIDKTAGAMDSAVFTGLAGVIAGYCPGKNDLPEELSRFPGHGLIPGTERYHHRNFKSHSFLNRVLSCDYKGKQGTKTLFIAINDSPDRAVGVLAGLLKLYPDSTNLKKAGIYKKHRSLISEKCSAVQSGKFVIGVLGDYSGEHQQLLEYVFKEFGKKGNNEPKAKPSLKERSDAQSH